MESHLAIYINNLKIFKSSDSVIHFSEHTLRNNLFTHSTNNLLSAYHILVTDGIAVNKTDLISALVELRRAKYLINNHKINV